MSINKVVGFIKKHKAFLITSHTNTEGDALGSELGFYFLIKKLGKQAVILNEEPVPYGYEFLPGLNRIRRFKHNIRDIKFDCLVAVDCSDLKRTGEVYMINSLNKPVLNIDHHISNSYFATVNWVDPSASCASEMVYSLYKKFRVALDKQAALALYTGILTDTGSFRFSNTTSFTHEVVAELLSYGIDVGGVYKYIYGNIPYSDLRLLTKILPTMKVEMKAKLVWFKVHRQLLKQQKIFFDLSETLLSFARTLKGMEVALLFRENLAKGHEIRVNMRSQGKIDVNKIANFFGGGGHKNASGCTIRDLTIDQVVKMVLTKVKTEFTNQRIDINEDK